MDENQAESQETAEQIKPAIQEMPEAKTSEQKTQKASGILNYFKEKFENLKKFITECKRVLRITKKPDREEFLTIVKISSIGMGLIGLIGFIVFFIKHILTKL